MARCLSSSMPGKLLSNTSVKAEANTEGDVVEGEHLEASVSYDDGHSTIRNEMAGISLELQKLFEAIRDELWHQHTWTTASSSTPNFQSSSE